MNIWQKAWFAWQLRQGIRFCPKEVQHWLQDLPPLKMALQEVSFLALDFETTGLNPKQDAILSMGWVPVTGGRIQLGQGAHWIIQSPQTYKGLEEESIKIHGITHQAMLKGIPLPQALQALWQALRGSGNYSRIPLVHFARIEKQFLAAACQSQYGCCPPLAMVDTFDLALRQFPVHTAIDSSQFRLARLREKYHLPPAPPHHALEDAIATAELFLAQLKYRQDADRLVLSDLLV